MTNSKDAGSNRSTFCRTTRSTSSRFRTGLKGPMKKLILVVCLCSFSSKLAAQQAETGVEGLRFVAPMQIAVGADNNFLVDRVQPGTPDVHTQRLDDKVLMLTLPKVAYQNDSRRRQFVLSWVPEFELFKNNSDQNAMNHEALASFSYHLR